MKPIRIPDWFTGVTLGAWLNLTHAWIGVMAAAFVLFPLSEVSAQLVCSPNWTAAYKCMEHCGPCPGSGGYVAPQQRSDDINSAGVQASNAGNWALAASLFQQALQINPNNPAAAINLRRTQAIMVNEDGMKAVNARNWSLAESLFEQASRINPNDPAIASNLLKVRTLIQGLADQRATEEQNNAARDQINSQALAEAEAKRKAAIDLINSQVLAEAEAKRKAASDVLNSHTLAEAEAKRKAASDLINGASNKPDGRSAGQGDQATPMPTRAAELVAALNDISQSPIFLNQRTGETNSPLPKGKPLDQKLLDTNCQTFFRALGKELARRGLNSWGDTFSLDKIGKPNADGIVAEIDKSANADGNWKKITSWEDAQMAADKGAVVIGGMRADPNKPKSHGHIAIVVPTAPGMDWTKFKADGDGPFVRDGNEHPFKEENKLLPSTWGAIRASRAMPLARTAWYVWSP
jgi:hypothetical protein